MVRDEHAAPQTHIPARAKTSACGACRVCMCITYHAPATPSAVGVARRNRNACPLTLCRVVKADDDERARESHKKCQQIRKRTAVTAFTAQCTCSETRARRGPKRAVGRTSRLRGLGRVARAPREYTVQCTFCVECSTQSTELRSEHSAESLVRGPAALAAPRTSRRPDRTPLSQRYTSQPAGAARVQSATSRADTEQHHSPAPDHVRVQLGQQLGSRKPFQKEGLHAIQLEAKGTRVELRLSSETTHSGVSEIRI